MQIESIINKFKDKYGFTPCRKFIEAAKSLKPKAFQFEHDFEYLAYDTIEIALGQDRDYSHSLTPAEWQTVCYFLVKNNGGRISTDVLPLVYGRADLPVTALCAAFAEDTYYLSAAKAIAFLTQRIRGCSNNELLWLLTKETPAKKYNNALEKDETRLHEAVVNELARRGANA